MPRAISSSENVRYNTGYALIMAPFRTLTDNFGRLADRTLLLLQMLAYSAIPFLLYDTLRRRIDARCALITALLALVDPFGLQWAHFLLPGWLIALVTVAAFWLAAAGVACARQAALRADRHGGCRFGHDEFRAFQLCAVGGGFWREFSLLAAYPAAAA